MPTPIPPVIADYFRAANAHDVEAVAACFAADGVVLDEKEEIRGLAAIRAWKERVGQKYRATAVVRDVAEAGGETVATTEVSGNFPGSPVDLDYHFTLAGGRIARLEVR